MIRAVGEPQNFASEIQPYAVAALTVGASAVAAWFAGKWSIKSELEKLKRQRSFELRLEWYKKVIGTLGDFQTIFLEYAEAASQDEVNHKHVKTLNDKGNEFLKLLHNATREALLFGSPDTLRALTNMSINLNRVGESTEASEISKIKADVKHELESAYLALAADMRKHLGLEELNAKDMNVVLPIT
jgi:hypothetical protein